MRSGEIVLAGLMLVWVFAVGLTMHGERIKRRFVRRMNDDWMERGGSPWFVRVTWAVLRPFVGGA